MGAGTSDTRLRYLVAQHASRRSPGSEGESSSEKYAPRWTQRPSREGSVDPADRIDVQTAVRRLELRVNHAENSLGLLEAKIRLLSRRLDPLPMLSTPIWLAEGLTALLAEERDSVLPAAEAAVERIVRVAAAMNPGLEADLRSGPRGSVEVVWGTQARIRWLVQPGRIRWPGVEVRAYRVVDPMSGDLCAESFWTVHTLVADFERTLARFRQPALPGAGE